MKRLLSILLTITLLAGLTALPVGATADSDTSWYATVEGGWLRLRDGASFYADTVNSYDVGTSVQVLDATGDWYKVKTPDGSVGYMYSKYLARGSAYVPETLASYSGATSATIISANGYGVRLRSGPSTSYRIIRKYPVGTRAEILQWGSYWSRIRVNGVVGYMMNQFLSKDGGGINPPNPYYDGDATVWSSNGYGVRLRSGPGLGYSKIGIYSVGTQVTILEKGREWDRIRIGSRIGYMMNKFLIYNNNHAVTGVTLNNYHPVVGDVLSVQTVTPSSATVTFEWYASTYLRGSNASYTVTADDIGKQIRLVVKGAGCYTGYVASDPTAVVLGSGTVTGVTLNITQPCVGNVLKAASIVPAGAKVTYKWTDSATGTQLGTGDTYLVTKSDYDNGRYILLTVTGVYPYDGTASVQTDTPVQGNTSPQIQTSSPLEPAIKGVPYTATLKAIGGGSSFTWSCQSGSLPSGLSLNASTGVISGTVPMSATAKTYSTTVKVSNGIGYDEKAFDIEVQGQVAAPEFTPNGGAITEATPIALTLPSGSDAVIYYAFGSTPTASSTRYTKPFTLTETTTVNAIAIASGLANSQVVSKTFTIGAGSQVATPVISPSNGAGSGAGVINITLSCDTANADIYYTTNGSTPTISSTKYSGSPFQLSYDTYATVKAIAVLSGRTNSAIAEASYTSYYGLTLDADGGTVYNDDPEPTRYYSKDGKTLPSRDRVTKAGNKFDGWYNLDGTGPVTAIPVGAKGDKSYKAHWVSSNTSTITYNFTEGASLKPDVPTTYVEGEGRTLATKDEILNVPTGKAFGGWCTDSACTSAVVTAIPANATGNKEFYAKWVTAAPKQSYTITYVVNGVQKTGLTPATYWENEGALLPTAVPGITNFSGWYETANFTGNRCYEVPEGVVGNKKYYGADMDSLSTLSALDVTALLGLTAGAPASNADASTAFTITYASNDGANGSATNSSATDDQGAIKFTTLGESAFTREGYTLHGWNTNADGTSGTAYELNTAYDIAENLTLYAVWRKVAYTITYDLNGGAEPTTANPTSYTVETGDFTLNNPSKTDANGNPIAFTGWSGTGIEGTALTVTIPEGSMGDRAYTAHWEGESNGEDPVDGGFLIATQELTGEENQPEDEPQAQPEGETFNVTYYAEETGTPRTDPSGPFASGTSVTVRPGPEKDGYTFQVWNTKADESGRYYAATSSFTIESDVTLYAIWAADGTGEDNGLDNGLNNGLDNGLDAGANDGVVTGDGSGVITGDGSGIVTGDGSGVVTGDGSGIVTGDGSGIVTGDGSGVVTGDSSGVVTGDGSGVVTGDGSGVVTGNGSGVVTGDDSGVVTGDGSGANGGTTPTTYTLAYCAADGTPIASYSCTYEQEMTIAADASGNAAVWNTADGLLSYVTGDSLTVYQSMTLYYAGVPKTPSSGTEQTVVTEQNVVTEQYVAPEEYTQQNHQQNNSGTFVVPENW